MLVQISGVPQTSKGKICLVTPPSGFLLDQRVFVSLGILKIGAVLEQAGWEVDHLDLTGVENYEEAAADYKGCELFAITATTPQIPAAVKIRKALRGKAILGGPHPTLVHAAVKRGSQRALAGLDFLMQNFDTVVAGDGEKSIFRAIKEYGFIDADDPKSDLWVTSKEFSESPFPARHLVDMASYHYTVDGERATSAIFQLGCPFESLTGDTFIFTSRGFETISEYESRLGPAGEIVGSSSVWNTSESVVTRDGRGIAKNFISEGTAQTFEVVTKSGIPFKGTAGHLVLKVKDSALEWCSIGDLKSGDWLALKQPSCISETPVALTLSPKLRKIPSGGFRSKEILLPEVLDEDLAWLIGFVIGDGCLPKDGRPQIHVCVTNDIEDKLTRIVKEKFSLDIRVYDSKATGQMRHGWINSRRVYEFFVQTLGISPAKKHRVPDVIRISPAPVILAFLEGLWDADGYVTDRQNYLTTADSELAREVAMLVLMTGRLPHIQRIPTEKYGPNFRVCIALSERIPTGRAIYRSSKSGKWLWRTLRNPKGTGVRRQTLRNAGLSHPLDKDGWFYAPVESVRPAGVETVYDLSVPEGENFVASGFIAHNCGFCGGRFSPMLRRIRSRTSDSVVAEMLDINKKYGVRGLMAYDDELNVNKGLVELCRKIKSTGIDWRLRGFVKAELFNEEQAEAMYDAGFRWLLCGFESAHPRILKNINKKATLEDNTNMLRAAHKHGLKVKALMSFGHPGESEETIMATRDWLLAEKPDDFDCTVITTYPGTPYWDNAVLVEEPVYRYEFNGDALYMENTDPNAEVGYYKGKPGEYKAFVWTDYLSAPELVRLRDEVEAEVRGKLNIPYPAGAAAVLFEHSMSQRLPDSILRSTSHA
jgi:radical SAM superfamily enzyme YgiQ (UPF0313 family)/intein/homing endonuclease